MMRAAPRWTTISVLITLMLAGCGLSPETVMTGSGGGDTYRINIEFASVLNIPSGAKALVNGITVGHLAGVTLGKNTATAQVDVDRNRRLPKTTRAELRQLTLLGDIYIALLPPASDAGPMLNDGDSIPESQTVPPDNVETVMVSLGQIINGGPFARIQDVIRKTNDALPADPQQLRDLSAHVDQQLTELGAASDRLGKLIDNGSQMLTTLGDQRQSIQRLLDVGPDRFQKIQEMLLAVVELISDLRVLTRPGGELLVEPTYSSVKAILATADPLLMTLAESDHSLADNANAIHDLLVRKIVPFLSAGGQIDVQSIDDSQARASQVVDVLRAIGAV